VDDHILEMSDIGKSFPGVRALDHAHLNVRRGEVHALMGENGAGKSTLMKILMGIYHPDQGSISIDGHQVVIENPAVALRLGLSMIQQELSPIPEMTVSENIFLGREELYRGTPFVNQKSLNARTKKLLEEFKMRVSPSAKMNTLSVAQIQMIEIIKAISYNSRIIIMDEPTSALSDEEVNNLYETIRGLKRKDVAVVYISHRLEEIFEIADSVTVLRDGQFIGSEPIGAIDKDRLISMMVGRELTNIFPKQRVELKGEILAVRGLSRTGVFQDISFSVRKGEILGVAGLIGSGRSEVMRAVYGLDQRDAGEILLDGKPLDIRNVKDAIRHGIVMVNEDRKGYGLVLCRSIKENIALSNLDYLSRGKFFVNLRKEKEACAKLAKELMIKMSGINDTVESLSGGNQQKVVLAKSLMVMPDILILDEPTRGIDVGAKAEIHSLMGEFARKGMAIIMISSELPEIMGMSDRIMVMGEGKIRGIFNRKDVTQEDILKCALTGEVKSA